MLHDDNSLYLDDFNPKNFTPFSSHVRLGDDDEPDWFELHFWAPKGGLYI